MNKLLGKISKVISGTPYSALEIDLTGGGHIAAVDVGFATKTEFTTGEEVEVYFDELDVILAKSISGDTTIKNVHKGVVERVDSGPVLSKVFVKHKGTSVAAIVRTSSWESLGLSTGSEVSWLVKATRVLVGKP